MDTSVNIRPCALSECVDVLRVLHEAGVTSGVTDSVEALARLVWEYGDLFLVAEEGGEVIGSVIGGWDGWRGSIYRLAVLPTHRRRGVAVAVVEAVEKRLGRRGARRLSLMVEREREGAIAFWGSLKERGYTPDPHILRYFKNL